MKNTDAKQFRSHHWSLVVFRQHSKRQGVLTDREWCTNFIVCVFFTLTNWLWDRITNMLPCVHPFWLCQAVSCPYRPRTYLFLSPRKLVNRKLTAGATSKSKRPLQYKGMHCFKNIEWKQCEDMKSTFGSWLCSFFISFPCLIERNSGCKIISNETQNRNISISLNCAEPFCSELFTGTLFYQFRSGLSSVVISCWTYVPVILKNINKCGSSK